MKKLSSAEYIEKTIKEALDKIPEGEWYDFSFKVMRVKDYLYITNTGLLKDMKVHNKALTAKTIKSIYFKSL